MKALDHETFAREDPRRMSAVQLSRLGIEILNRYDLVLRCITCGESWSPQSTSQDMLPAGYWICPNKCNI